MEKSKWMAAMASIWIQCICGASYAFAIYSSVLKSTQGYDQSTLDMVSVFKDIGANAGILSGLLYSAVTLRRGGGSRPWVVHLAGAIQCFAGYFLIWLSVIGVINRPPVPAMCCFMLMAAHAQTFFNTANVVTAVHNFPDYSGTVVGIMKFRPISLCNFSLKVITKILANRLKGILRTVITPNQSAFVSGRLIQDNIIVAHEAFHALKLRKGNLEDLALKVDFHKAYDSVHWGFLRALLEKMGFHSKWVQWVMECVTTVSFSVLVNGAKRTSFLPSRGLRQGDPLSPYLFILVMDVFSKLIARSVQEGRLSGLRIRRGCPILSHLFFADDAVLFFKATIDECKEVGRLLQLYGDASGQSVNFDKSGVQFSGNISSSRQTEICEFLRIPKLKATARYLGLPSCWGRSKAEAFNFLCEKVLSKLQGWKAKLLSQAGREILIKAVAQALPTYAMACFLFPHKLCDKLSSYIRHFWWKGDPEAGGIHWCSWSRLCLNKRNGGLGFRDFRAFNRALLARQGWRLIKYPESLFAQIMKGIYYPHTNFCHASRGSRPSWAWVSLLQGREILRGGLRWQVLNGRSTHFWEDRWIPSNPGFKVLSARPSGTRVQLVNEVINPVSHTWDETQLRTLVSNLDCEAILSIPLASTEGNDTLVWHHDQRGCYTVKSGYQEAVKQAHMQCNLPGSSAVWSAKIWKLVWSLKMPPKLKHFVWRFYHNALATKQNLWRRRCAHSAVCPICLSEVETIEHLFFGCEWAKRAWFGSGMGFRCDDFAMGPVRNCLGQLITSLGTDCEGQKTLCSIVWMSWCIWKARNEYIFHHVPVDPIEVIATAERMEAEFLLACEDTSVSSAASAGVTYPVPHWVPPLHGTWKINCDAATDLVRGRGAIAVLLRDATGKLVDGIATPLRMTTALQGEACAVRLACSMARALHGATVEVESDCKTLIQLCVSEGVPPWEICAVMNDIWCMASSGTLTFKWCPRIQNRAAHWVASACLRNALPIDWVSQPPVALEGCL